MSLSSLQGTRSTYKKINLSQQTSRDQSFKILLITESNI